MVPRPALSLMLLERIGRIDFVSRELPQEHIRSDLEEQCPPFALPCWMPRKTDVGSRFGNKSSSVSEFLRCMLLFVRAKLLATPSAGEDKSSSA